MKYANSDSEVRIGDRVVYKRLFFGTSAGVMVYVPGESPLNDELEYDGIEHHVVRLSSGRSMALANACGDAFLSSRLNYISRGAGGSIALGPDASV